VKDSWGVKSTLPTSPLAKQLGACIRTLRQQTGLSQVEFGEKCGFYQTYLSRVENGKANPTINALEVVANALGLTVFDLFDTIHAIERTGKTSEHV
jgi:transcriptional regulator with XRE-family HTH domain